VTLSPPLNPVHSAVAGIVKGPFAMFSRPRLVLGLQPRIFIKTPVTSARTALLARRLISNSTCSHAEHDHRKPKLEHLSSGIEERLAHSAHLLEPEHDSQGNELNAYRHGPSALDKAVHLFFFTEIIRGRCTIRFSMTWLISCIKGCGSYLRTSSAHHIPSCIPSRKVLYPLVSVASTPCAATPVGRSDVSVGDVDKIPSLLN